MTPFYLCALRRSKGSESPGRYRHAPARMANGFKLIMGVTSGPPHLDTAGSVGSEKWSLRLWSPYMKTRGHADYWMKAMPFSRVSNTGIACKHKCPHKTLHYFFKSCSLKHVFLKIFYIAYTHHLPDTHTQFCNRISRRGMSYYILFSEIQN